MTELAANDPLPKPKRDIAPILLPIALALLVIPLVGSPSTWLTLTAASLAMGMMIFIMASGLTLVFGLMDVLNFGHGAFIAVGAYVATLVLAPFAASIQADSLWMNLAVLAPAALLSMAVSGALGLVVERVLILPVYGQHLKQILMTTGGLIVAEQTLYALWGPQIIPMPLPTSLRGSFILGDVAIAKYRVLATLIGLAVFIAIQLVLNRTKLGLLIRAGVENREMVEALALSHPPPVPRRVHDGLRARRPRRSDVGALSRAGPRLHERRPHRADLHRRHHRRPRVDRRLLHRRDPGGDGRQLRRLPGAETRPRLQHPADGRHSDVAAARPLCGDQPMMILSGDPPRSRVLTLVLVLIILALAATPFLFPGAKALNVAAKICVFAALVASYDLLLGYTGSVSFAHTMFYGIGSYAIAIALYGMGPNWAAVATGIVVGLPLAALLALAIGLFSLRVAAIFFAMITLAVASAFQVLASQLSWLTGGEDGRSFQLPELLRPGTVLISRNLFGFEVNGRILTYYLVLAISALMILALLRVVNSPFGRVLQAIRENRFRAEALGFRTVFHLTYANCLAALVAASAGILNALWLRYAGPDTSLSFSIMLDILLMVVIGGMGTIYGAIIGATIFILAQNYLQSLMGVASKAASEAGLPLLPGLLHPDRWLLWLGLLFIASVYFFPTGVVGRLRSGGGDKSAGASH
ncbi:ABC-type branched-subunit amino acid transport system permease subunit [Bradyrhizobium japonicum]